MKNEVEEVLERPSDFQGRIDPLDIELANLDARIEKNRAELERNNAELEAKLAELSRRIHRGV